MRKIYMYNGGSEQIPIMEFINKAHPKVQKKFNFVLRIVADDTKLLTEPYVKHFTIEKYRCLYELRLKAMGTMVRIIYYEADQNIILLHAFVKRDRRDTVQALEYSLKLIEKLDREAQSPYDCLTEVRVK